MDYLTVGRVLAARVARRPAPVSLTYEVTHRCNLACVYCDRHRAMPDEMRLERMLGALGQFYDLGMRRVCLDGGEALLHPDIDALVSWLSSRAVTVVMNSNGILVPGELETVRQLALLKISLDGPRSVHDSMRGAGSFDRALAGADAAMAAGVRVEFSCVVGRHNAGAVRELIDIVEERRSSVVFQPVLSSLFIGRPRDGSAFELSPAACRQAFAQIEKEKRRTRAVGNGWSSLRHFRRFPADTPIPCAAGWIFATLDPEGVLFVCDQVDRVDRSNSVLRLGARAAFARLDRRGCGQCWCARLVEGNLQWGGRIDKMLPPLLHDKLKCRCRLVIRSRARGEGKRSGEAPK